MLDKHEMNSIMKIILPKIHIIFPFIYPNGLSLYINQIKQYLVGGDNIDLILRC